MQQAVKHHALANWHTPFANIGKMVKLQLSASLVWRILDEAGYHQRKAIIVVFLTPAQKAARYQWANNYKGWGPDKTEHECTHG